ncbi:uncharacterized protein LOC124454695 [Xenia sp. Carnegie-2017]|uniref:uncharacterized protein LOC124454695 n=1 Tax=Xenia sp. Carnegie-2017 TaxID=2897299 RepID=UPI001F04457B|nr:uncharacterized protein LOC124454695 [Xenia sp. Carnegie-2017]
MIGHIFVFFLVIIACRASEDASQCTQTVFRKFRENGGALAENDAISSHVVRNLMECSMVCALMQQCVGFNYLDNVQEYLINCQTSNKTISNVSKIVSSEGNWIFYQTSKIKEPAENENNWIVLSDTSFLKDKNDWIVQLKQWLPSTLNGKKAVHCYQATINGWEATTFHSLCDNKGPTLVIVKVGTFVFGGFASESWKGDDRYIRANRSFIFSLKNNYGLPPFKSEVVKPQYAIYDYSAYGPTFGGGHDLYISDNANSNYYSHSRWFGHSYKLPNGYTYQSITTQNLLAGTSHFTPDEVEVFYFSS